MKIIRMPGDRYVVSIDSSMSVDEFEVIKRAWEEWIKIKPAGIEHPIMFMGEKAVYEDHSVPPLEERVKRLEEMLS